MSDYICMDCHQDPCCCEVECPDCNQDYTEPECPNCHPLKLNKDYARSKLSILLRDLCDLDFTYEEFKQNMNTIIYGSLVKRQEKTKESGELNK